MTTEKIRIQAYVERSLFERFEAERKDWHTSQSQGLERLLSERYGINIDNPNSERLERLERQYQELAHQLEGLKLIVFGNQTNDLAKIYVTSPDDWFSESPGEVLEQDSELLSEHPVPQSANDPQRASELLSESPELISSELPGESFVLCRLLKNKSGDPQYWRFWGGARYGFTFSLKFAKLYASESSVKRQLSRLTKDPDQTPTDDEFFSYRRYGEIARLIAMK